MAETTILNNRYRLEERLGSGGMAMVYRARDLTLERTVAIKILRHNLSENSEFRSRFHQEAKAAANLSHPNIVTVHDFGFYASQLFIVMEYVPGSDLKTLLQQKRPFEHRRSHRPDRPGLRRSRLRPPRRAGALRRQAAEHAGHARPAPEGGRFRHRPPVSQHLAGRAQRGGVGLARNTSRPSRPPAAPPPRPPTSIRWA